MTSEPSCTDPKIEVDVLYPSVTAAWEEFVARGDWYQGYTEATRHCVKCAFYTAAAEVVRLIAHRLTFDQSMAVFGDLDRELAEVDRALINEAARLAKQEDERVVAGVYGEVKH